MITKKSTVRKLIAIGALSVLFAVLYALSTNTVVCEFFAKTFSRAWIWLFGHIFSILPFSVYELFLIVAIVLAIVFIVYLFIFIAKKRWNKLVSMVLIAVICVFSFLNIYTLSASFAYGREELPKDIYTQYTSEDLTCEDAISIATWVVDNVNIAYLNTEHDNNGNIVYPYSFDEISDMLADEYKKLKNDYFSSYTPKAKKIINKTIMSEMQILGVFFAPTGEANINGNEKGLFLPDTLAHELAHSKGVMREYQADIVGRYVLLTSGNDYLRYGTLVKCLSSALSILSAYPEYQEISDELNGKIDSRIFDERKNDSKFYAQFNHFDRIGEFFNDLYLKLQKQPEGTGSYVKPPEIIGSGEYDDDTGEEIMITHFSGMQNLLITLYKQNLLK